MLHDIIYLGGKPVPYYLKKGVTHNEKHYRF